MEQKNKKLVLTKETISSLSNRQYGSNQAKATYFICFETEDGCTEPDKNTCIGYSCVNCSDECGGSQCDCKGGRGSDTGGGDESVEPDCETYTRNTYCGTCQDITCADTCGGGATCKTCNGASACNPDVCTNTFAATCEELTCGLKCDTYDRASCYPCGTVMC